MWYVFLNPYGEFGVKLNWLHSLKYTQNNSPEQNKSLTSCIQVGKIKVHGSNEVGFSEFEDTFVTT